MITSRIREMVVRCSRCGKCSTVCPVFAEMQAEPYLARGKVQLLKALLDGALKPTKEYGELMSSCLLCGECSAICPNEINMEDIVLAAKGELFKVKGLPFVKKSAFQYFFNSDGDLTVEARLLSAYQRSGIQGIVRKTPLFSKETKEQDRLLPRIAATFLRDDLRHSGKVEKGCLIITPKGEVKSRVGYFTGCMSQYVFTETAKRVVKVLCKAGIEVVIPQQLCCGMPALSVGDTRNITILAKKNIKNFSNVGVDTVITDCATCGFILKVKYPELLGEDLPFQLYDISEYLVKHTDIQNLLAKISPGHTTDASRETRVTYHDPCRLSRYMRITEEPRELLKGIQGFKLMEMEEADRCCGASGSFQFEHRDLSAKIGKRKAENIEKTGAQFVATGCPSCRLQLARSLGESGSEVKVVHPVDLLFM